MLPKRIEFVFFFPLEIFSRFIHANADYLYYTLLPPKAFFIIIF